METRLAALIGAFLDRASGGMKPVLGTLSKPPPGEKSKITSHERSVAARALGWATGNHTELLGRVLAAWCRGGGRTRSGTLLESCAELESQPTLQAASPIPSASTEKGNLLGTSYFVYYIF